MQKNRCKLKKHCILKNKEKLSHYYFYQKKLLTHTRFLGEKGT